MTFLNQLRLKIIIKCLTVGMLGAILDMSLFFYLNRILNIWYIYSTMASHFTALFNSFFLQKYLVFDDKSREKILKQLSLFLAAGLVNWLLDAGILLVLVEKFNLWKIFAKIISISLLGTGSFLFYQFIIFKIPAPK